MLKKYILAICLCLALLFIWHPAEAQAIDIEVDGKVLQTDVAPDIKNNRTYVPLRAIMESVGSEVNWDQATSTATAKKDGLTVSVILGKHYGWANGGMVDLETPPYVKNQRTMVPLRFMLEALGATVEWTDGKVIIFTDNTNQTTPDPIPEKNIASTKNFTLLVNGQEPAFKDQSFFFLRTWEPEEGVSERLLVPLKPAVEVLTPVSKFGTFSYPDKPQQQWDYFETPSDIYVCDTPPRGKYAYYTEQSCQAFFKNLKGEYLIEAEHLCSILGAKYEYNPQTKTINITTKMQQIKNGELKNHYIINDPEEVLPIINKHLLNYKSSEEVLDIYFYPTYLQGLKPEYIFGEGIENYPLAKMVSSLNYYGSDSYDKNHRCLFVNSYGFPKNDRLVYQDAYNLKIPLFFYKDDTLPMITKVNLAAEEIVSKTIKPNMSDREKIKVLHDYLIDHAEYWYNPPGNTYGYSRDEWEPDHDIIACLTAYGTLVKGKGVCASYAEALMFLLAHAGFESAYIGATVIDDGHAWTAVKLDGKWYHIDATWNDTMNTNKYFMRTEEEVNADPEIISYIYSHSCIK